MRLAVIFRTHDSRLAFTENYCLTYTFQTKLTVGN